MARPSSLRSRIWSLLDRFLAGLAPLRSRIPAPVRSRLGSLVDRFRPAPPPPPEPPIEPEYLQWREMYANREQVYATFAEELRADDPEEEERRVSEFYIAGGSGYDPVYERRWLYEHTPLPDMRGTCLDVGSADGFMSIILSEWFHVYGIEPSRGAVGVANAIKERLPAKIANRIEYIHGDALEVEDRYDVVFCSAPTFFNYPPDGSFDESMLDWDRSNLRQALELSHDPETADRMIREYPPEDREHPYAYKFRWCLERMLAATNKLFWFSISTNPLAYGEYTGGTYCHDPETIEKVFSEYGKASAKLVDNSSRLVAEIWDPRIPDPPPSESVPQKATA
jgi:SAM-dependent methyltransferase